jgi:hypothetical protein
MTIQYLERAVPEPNVFLFYQEIKFISETSNLRDMFKKTSMSVCISNIVISPDPVSYSINFSSNDDSRKHNREPC